MPKPYIDPEHRTPEEELRALGALNIPAVEDVRWVKPYRSHPKAGLIKLGTNIIHLPDFITDDLGEKLLIGTGRYKGCKVLTIRAVGEGEKGYNHHRNNNGNKRMINNPRLVQSLLQAGVTLGYYKPSKIRGGWMGEKV